MNSMEKKSKIRIRRKGSGVVGVGMDEMTGEAYQLGAEAELAAGEAGGAEEVPEGVEEQRVEERLGQLDVAEVAGAEIGVLRAGLAAAWADGTSESASAGQCGGDNL